MFLKIIYFLINVFHCSDPSKRGSHVIYVQKKGTFVSIPFPNRLVSLCMIHSSQRSLMNYLGTASQFIHRLNQAILSFAPSVLPRKIKGLSSRWVFTGRAVCLKSLIILISYIIWH